MDCIASRLPYRQTGAFNKIVLDYIDRSENLRNFFAFNPTIQGIQQAINERTKTPVNRETLVRVLKVQYKDIEATTQVTGNISLLAKENSFTVTTAHQNNLFTGPLYVIYKIVHVIRLSAFLKESFPSMNFIPVFYMGSEDADLSELNHIYLGGEKLEWETSQTGAVGRMLIDKKLTSLIERIAGQLSVFPSGEEIISKLKECYVENRTIQDATFRFLNELFGEYGLVILIADHKELKSQAIEIFKDDLQKMSPSAIVSEATGKLSEAGYDVQANPREINLFYLDGNKRERILPEANQFKVANTDISFSPGELMEELTNHPEKFSPNVILRGLYQAKILPDVCFVGGGGELAYWLELKSLFAHYKVPFPVLVLRNSFLVLEKKSKELLSKLNLKSDDIFQSQHELESLLIKKISTYPLQLNGSMTAAQQLYEDVKTKISAVDPSLEKHVESLKVRTMERLQQLEKKLMRAEKRKHQDKLRQLRQLKSRLFPGGGLQERQENLLYYYARWGNDFIRKLLQHSPALEQEFTIITES